MQIETANDVALVGLGILIGGLLATSHMLVRRKREVDGLVDEMNLRTELINWVITEGVYLEGEQFFPQFSEKASFINIITTH